MPISVVWETQVLLLFSLEAQIPKASTAGGRHNGQLMATLLLWPSHSPTPFLARPEGAGVHCSLVAGKCTEIGSSRTEHLHRFSLCLTKSFIRKALGGEGSTTPEKSKYTISTLPK